MLMTKQHPDVIGSHLFLGMEWQYFVTFTIYGGDVSTGDCYFSLYQFFTDVQKQDPDVEFVLYICQRDMFDRPHVHGVVNSSVAARKLESMWRKSYGLCKVKKMDNSRRCGLYNYIKVQAVGSAIYRDDLLGGKEYEEED